MADTTSTSTNNNSIPFINNTVSLFMNLYDPITLRSVTKYGINSDDPNINYTIINIEQKNSFFDNETSSYLTIQFSFIDSSVDIESVEDFAIELEGNLIELYADLNNSPTYDKKPSPMRVFLGYVRNSSTSVTATSGTIITLSCKTLLYQLYKLSSYLLNDGSVTTPQLGKVSNVNSSEIWNNLASSKVKFIELLGALLQNSLYEKALKIGLIGKPVSEGINNSLPYVDYSNDWVVSPMAVSLKNVDRHMQPNELMNGTICFNSFIVIGDELQQSLNSQINIYAQIDGTRGQIVETFMKILQCICFTNHSTGLCVIRRPSFTADYGAMNIALGRKRIQATQDDKTNYMYGYNEYSIRRTGMDIYTAIYNTPYNLTIRIVSSSSSTQIPVSLLVTVPKFIEFCANLHKDPSMVSSYMTQAFARTIALFNSNVNINTYNTQQDISNNLIQSPVVLQYITEKGIKIDATSLATVKQIESRANMGKSKNSLCKGIGYFLAMSTYRMMAEQLQSEFELDVRTLTNIYYNNYYNPLETNYILNIIDYDDINLPVSEYYVNNIWITYNSENARTQFDCVKKGLFSLDWN